MKKRQKLLASILLGLALSVQTGPASASLMIIGTATISNTGTYNLIYDNEAPYIVNGASQSTTHGIVWLDYARGAGSWNNHTAWAESLNNPGTVIYHFNGSYSMNWNSGWRLPDTVNADSSIGWPPPIDSSELAHLYFQESIHGSTSNPYFTTLTNDYYWSNTQPNDGTAWLFGMGDRWQGGVNTNPGYDVWAMAVRSGELGTVVPEPSTLLLLGIGLAWLAVYAHRKTNCC